MSEVHFKVQGSRESSTVREGGPKGPVVYVGTKLDCLRWCKAQGYGDVER